ncbi:hypothetical protein ABKA04_009755 [Annulohypoxylon sp. FPYF3050]
MAHSPLLRTLMRLRLDSRSVALVNYELALEDVSIKLQQLPNVENFDHDRWTELRKIHESKRMRDAQQKTYERDFTAKILEKRKLKKAVLHRSPHDTTNISQTWKGIIPRKTSELQLVLAKSGITGWRPPLPSDSLLSENYTYNPSSSGCVSMAEMGLIDRRLLHSVLSPKYVPKPHFKMERQRLEDKSAEYLAFAENNRHMIPRPQDESSDEALLSMDEPEDSEVDGKKRKVGLGKRKRVTKDKPKKRARKPPRFIKMYDCKAYDRSHLNSQAINVYSLMQQRLPVIECPAFERVNKAVKVRKDKPQPSAPMQEPIEVDEDPLVEQSQACGILLPMQFPFEENSEGEPREPTIEDVTRYQAWRQQSQQFFEQRDRYMQSRIYSERVNSRELSHSAQALMAFWSKIKAQLDV